jgi:hypothetical protein
VVSCIRLTAVVQYATSTNPMYDNLMSGVKSIGKADDEVHLVKLKRSGSTPSMENMN